MSPDTNNQTGEARTLLEAIEEQKNGVSDYDTAILQQVGPELAERIEGYKPKTIVYVCSSARLVQPLVKGICEALGHTAVHVFAPGYRQDLHKTDSEGIRLVVELRVQEIIDICEPPYLIVDDYLHTGGSMKLLVETFERLGVHRSNIRCVHFIHTDWGKTSRRKSLDYDGLVNPQPDLLTTSISFQFRWEAHFDTGMIGTVKNDSIALNRKTYFNEDPFTLRLPQLLSAMNVIRTFEIPRNFKTQPGTKGRERALQLIQSAETQLGLEQTRNLEDIDVNAHITHLEGLLRQAIRDGYKDWVYEKPLGVNERGRVLRRNLRKMGREVVTGEKEVGKLTKEEWRILFNKAIITDEDALYREC